MVDAHASGACEETHGGSSPFIGNLRKEGLILGLFTPVVPKEQRWFTRSSILPRKAHSSPTVQAESLHRQFKKEGLILGLFTPVVPKEQRWFTRSSILPRKAHSSPTVQAESLHRQFKKRRSDTWTLHPGCFKGTTVVYRSSILPVRLILRQRCKPSPFIGNLSPSPWERAGVRVL